MFFEVFENGVKCFSEEAGVRLIFKENHIIVWDASRDPDYEPDAKYGKVAEITAIHDTLCCEDVYAEIPTSSYLNDPRMCGNTILFEVVPGFGFRIGLGNDDWHEKAFLWESIPCYSVGDNRYSSEIMVLFDNFVMLDFHDIQEKE